MSSSEGAPVVGDVEHEVAGSENAAASEVAERARRQWADAFEHCAHGMAMGNPVTGKVLACNPALARLLGRRVDEIVGRAIVEFYVPSERPRVIEHLAQVDRTGRVQYESQLQRRDGSAVHVQMDLVSVYDDNHRVLYRVATAQDITDRKRAEEKVSELQSQLESALEAGEMGVWLWDLRRDQIWGNESLRQLVGLEPEVPEWFPSEVAYARIHQDDRARVRSALDRALTEESQYVDEYRIVLPSGQVRWLGIRARIERDPDGAPRRVLGVHMDITRQKLAREHLAQTQKLEALGTLSAGIAHDFNNVLQAIVTNATLAFARISRDSPLAENIRNIASAAERATKLVRQILAFGRPQVARRQQVVLAQVVEEVLRFLRSTTPSSIDLEARVSACCPLVRADPTELHQVVVNLATNAVHAIGGRSGKVEFAIEGVDVDAQGVTGIPALRPGHYALLTVRDTGCGMEESTLARAFDPFFTTKPPGVGTGLGLSVVHGIVRGLGGAIGVETQIGRGSVFRVYFPGYEREVQPEEAEPPLQRGGGERVLFVDDERALISAGAQLLEHLGYQAEVFDCPELALAAFRAHPEHYRAVLTDLSMPKLTGFELSAQVLAIRPTIPVILMTGYAGPDEQAQAEQLGIRELVAKPMSLATLAAALQRHLH